MKQFLSLLVLFSLFGFSTLPARPGLAAAASFEEILTGLPGVEGGMAAWGDCDNDGDLDVLLSGNTPAGPLARVYRNDGPAAVGWAFTDLQANLPGLSNSAAAWGDFDHDGDLDILLAGLRSGVRYTRIYRNDGPWGAGSGAFVDIAASLPGLQDGAAAWGDFDNDGDLDALLTGNTGTQTATYLFRNNAGAFSEVAIDTPGLIGVQHAALEWADFDQDGDLDILLAGDPGSLYYTSRVYRNDGPSATGWKFSNIFAALEGVSGAAAWGDYDSDGDLDVLLAGYGDLFKNEEAKIYRNDGPATEGWTFIDTGAVLQALGEAAGGWGDWDNDGDPDALLTGAAPFGPPPARIYSHDGADLFSSAAMLPGVSGGSAGWGDFDSDGDLDVLLTGRSGETALTILYRNGPPAANTRPTAPAGLSVIKDGASVVLQWQPASDAQTPPAGLTYNLRVGTQPGGRQIVAPMSLPGGERLLPAAGGVGHTLFARLDGLDPNQRYYWSVQAVDSAWAGSPFAAEHSFVLSENEPPLAAFSASNLTPMPGEVITFTNTTSGTAPLTFLWNFGDGATSTLQRPLHIYTTGGEFTVTLTAANSLGESQASLKITVGRRIYLPVVKDKAGP